MATYSFLNTVCALVGPGGYINLGEGAAVAEEGITINAAEDINEMKVGADGKVMHSLHANKSGEVVIRLQKTSQVNSLLSSLYAIQTASSITHGRNTITLNNLGTGDAVTCQQVAFKKAPDLTYAKDGGTVEWHLDAGVIDRVLGVPL